MRVPRKQIHLAAHFPGVNNTTVWSDPAAGSHIEFDSFVRLAQTAERAKFDFFFLAEGLRLREQHGRIYDLDVVGRPDTFTVLAALAAVTDRIGLAGTINSTFNEPFEVARQFASLDHLSAGRAAWNVVTSWDAFTGENFRRGGFLAQEDRYERARTFLQTAFELFDSWRGDEVVADQAAGRFLTDGLAGTFEHRDRHFDIDGQFPVPRSPQGRPVIFQAGDSDEGREFAAADADAIFSRHSTFEAGQAFYRDVKGRLARHGRRPDELRILPAATFVLGDTEADAAARAQEIRLQQVSPATAIQFLEQVWNHDLSDHDPDGPLPAVDPVPGENTVSRGRASVRMHRDPVAVAHEWRARAEAEGLTTRELIVEVTGRQSFIGTPATVADTIDRFVQEDAADGFILVPHITPSGLDEFADTVVPLLQERGSFRADYDGPTLRDHLGLAPLDRPSPAGRERAERVGGPGMTATPLGVLDLVPIPSGSSASQALRNSVDLAQHAERLGYTRFWFAEHHLNPGVAGTSPAVTLALTAAATSSIRIGAGAVQLGHRTALSTVEEFGLLDAMHPGRIDLGLGRSGGKPAPIKEPALVGGSPRVVDGYTANGVRIPRRFSPARLLQSPRFVLQRSLLTQPEAKPQNYTEQVGDILDLLAGTYVRDGQEAHVVPGEGAQLQVWVLGSSGGESATVAGERGLRFGANYHVSPATVLEAVDGYRAAFRPSATLDRPYVTVSVDVVVAPTEAKARERALGYGLWVRSIRTGAGAIPFPTPEQARRHQWSDEDRELVQDRLETQFVGTAQQVADQLERLRDATGADELLITTITHDHADRVRSYELLAEQWARR